MARGIRAARIHRVVIGAGAGVNALAWHRGVRQRQRKRTGLRRIGGKSAPTCLAQAGLALAARSVATWRGGVGRHEHR
jgi:hypothetical protein